MGGDGREGRKMDGYDNGRDGMKGNQIAHGEGTIELYAIELDGVWLRGIFMHRLHKYACPPHPPPDFIFHFYYFHFYYFPTPPS